MKVTELMRGLLDLIDGAEPQQEQPQVTDYEEEVIVPVQEPECDTVVNRPNEIYTALELINTMGNDLNAMKKPEDVKSATFPMFFGIKNG